MVAGGIRQMLSVSPENVNNDRASFRVFRFHVYTRFFRSCTDAECENVKGVPKVHIDMSGWHRRRYSSSKTMTGGGGRRPLRSCDYALVTIV